MKYIKRSIEHHLMRTCATFKAVLVTGSRQVGKSTLLKKAYSKTSYKSFDDQVLLYEAKTEPGLFMQHNTPPVILDEVQYATDLFPYIKMICDENKKKGLFLLTGSQPFRLMRHVSESLAGRVAILELLPLSLREILGVGFNKHFVPTNEYLKERGKKLKHCENIWKIIHRGSYPEIQDSKIDWQTFYASYVQTYLERDINDLVNIKDKLKFTQFLTVVAARTGQMLNYANIADELEISAATVKEWISILVTSGLAFVLQPFSNSALHRAIKTPKIYFKDTGLVCYLTKWHSAEAVSVSAVAGNIFETYVVSEIIKSYANEGLDYSFYLYYYRGKDKIRHTIDGEASHSESEIDLILAENGTLYPLEIKMTANPKRSMIAAFSVLDNVSGFKRGQGAVICLYNRKLALDEMNYALPVEYI